MICCKVPSPGSLYRESPGKDRNNELLGLQCSRTESGVYSQLARQCPLQSADLLSSVQSAVAVDRHCHVFLCVCLFVSGTWCCAHDSCTI
ncbi:hypothetical protein J6590_043608 [Homalodisca vitripennis]|nr:hypothetical protein J6590_043608 [Homalodisca vitripennis]